MLATDLRREQQQQQRPQRGFQQSRSSDVSARSSTGGHFNRGEKTSMSVRLRKKKKSSGGGAARHSGDFSYRMVNTGERGGETVLDARKNSAQIGNWAFITFPSEQKPEELGSPVGSERVGPSHGTPIKVVTRDVPGVTSNLERMLSASTANVFPDHKLANSRPQPPSYQKHHPAAQSRNLNSPRNSSSPNVRRQSMAEVNLRRSSVMLTSQPTSRKNEAPVPTTSTTEHCSEEFSYVASESKRVTNPALGRRSATQLQIEHNQNRKKKNSYSEAVYKSQENLVKPNLVLTNDFASSSLENPGSTLKKGLMWSQRDKFFSRWKERYFVLTKDYLNCFKRGTSKISEMGDFLYKVKICDIDDVELLDKRGYLTICLALPREGKIYLRKTEGIRDWFRILKESHQEAVRNRLSSSSASSTSFMKRMASTPSMDTEKFWSRKQVTDSSSIENWIQNRKKKGLLSNYSDSTPDINKATTTCSPSKAPEITLSELSALYRHADDMDDCAIPEQAKAEDKVIVRLRNKGANGNSPGYSNARRKPKIINRLSLMSDIELPDFGHHQNIDLDKGVFLKKNKSIMDSHSNDSGNHSMSTNASLSSSSSSKSKESSTDDRHHEVMHRTVVHVGHDIDEEEDGEDRFRDLIKKNPGIQGHRRSSYAHGLQITHV